MRFAFRLALALGEWDVIGMLDKMPASLFGLWMDYYTLEPFGQERGDLQAGVVAATVANLFISKDDKPATPSDFLLRFEGEGKKPSEPQTWEEQLTLVELWNAALGGKDLRSRE